MIVDHIEACKKCFALVNVKREGFLHEFDAIDRHDLMDSDPTKWNCISQRVMKVGFSHVCHGASCKDE